MFASKDSLLTRPSGYNIARSVRLRSSASGYFNRTPATATNQKVWTWSGWVKRGALGNQQSIFATVSQGFSIFFDSGGDLRVWTNGGNGSIYTSAVYRDVGAWYHIVLQRTSASPYFNLYVNGVQVTAFAYDNRTTYPGTANSEVNSTVAHYISGFTGYYFDGYLTEINFIDGQALTPSSFGETDSITGVWKPKAYSGSYGTNGFELNFSDNSNNTAATIGKDYSGNGNNWTPNNISVTAGVTYDSMTDVPTLTSATAANYCVMNPLATNTVGVATLTNGNLTFSVPNTFTAIGSMSATSGKFYWEAIATSNPVGVGLKQVNVLDRYSNTIYYMGSSLSPSGEKYVNGSASAYGASWTTGDVIGIAVDMDGGTVTFYKNNASQGSIALSTASITAFVPSFVAGAGVTFAGSVNFGQRPFSYTPPTGFVALNTYNLPASTITNGAAYMAATLYTGNGSSQSINNSVNSISFQPDWIWAKGRSSGVSNSLYDSIRGVRNTLASNATNAENLESAGYSLTAFNSNGFSVGIDNVGIGSVNGSAITYVAWQWKAGTTSASNTNGTITSTVSVGATQGFSVITFNGTGANATVGHGLGVAPSMIIMKQRNNAGFQWPVYHGSLATDKYLFLQRTDGQLTSSTIWQNTRPTSSVIYLGPNGNDNNNTSSNMVAYCFSAVAGYSAFGSYTGNASTDGPFVYLGFRPRWVMVKRTDTAGNSWYLEDSSRNTYNPVNLELYADLSNAEATSTDYDFLSNGFKIRASHAGINASGGTYIYACFAENPFRNALAR